MDNFQSGAAIDNRSGVEKVKDIKFKEVVASAAVVNWVEKAEDQWRKFPDQEQDGSGSCVAQTIKKLALILLWLKEKAFVTFSATDLYSRRSNKPGSGMIGVEAFELWRSGGITLEQLAKSENMSDAQMDAMVIEQYKRDIGNVFKIGGHIGIDNGDFETVASVIQQTGKGVMAWFYFAGDEFSSKIPVVKNPNLDLYGPSTARHSVAVVDFFLFAGKKFLLIEDSAHFGGLTRRLISEEFFAARNWFVRYPMNFTFQPAQVTPVPSLPHFHFSKPLGFDMTDLDVVILQNMLKLEGLFPTNVASTGYFGSMTAKSVVKWQVKHGLNDFINETDLRKIRFGEKSITLANKLYA